VTSIEPKQSAVCGRKIEWRKKWEKNWSEVKYCGERCRRAKGTLAKEGAVYEARILALLQERPRGALLTEAEVMGNAGQDQGQTEKIREAARRLVHRGELEIIQGGKPVDPSAFRGPIHLRIK
jgi:hypothetical protein